MMLCKKTTWVTVPCHGGMAVVGDTRLAPATIDNVDTITIEATATARTAAALEMFFADI